MDFNALLDEMKESFDVSEQEQALYRDLRAIIRGGGDATEKIQVAIRGGLAVKRVLEIAERAYSEGQQEQLSLTALDGYSLESVLDTLGISIRFNIRAQRVEHKGTEGIWRPINDRWEAGLRDILARTFTYRDGSRDKPLRYSPQIWRSSLDAVAGRNEIDPFREWLESLPPTNPTIPLDRWIETLFELKSNDYLPFSRWASTYLLLGPIWRAYHEDVKLDEMPILVGPQGIGKSTCLKHLLPPAYQSDWFSDGLRMDADNRTRIESTLGRVIVEPAELVGMTRADLANLKNYITATNDGHQRLAYRRNPESLPRRFVLAGTGNDETPLPNDPSGNRRFIVISLARSRYGAESFMAQHRDSLWSSALELYHAGQSASLPRSLAHNASALSDRHKSADYVMEDVISEIPRSIAITIKEIMFQEPGLTRQIGNSKVEWRLQQALKANGWRPIRKWHKLPDESVGKQRRVWITDEFPGES